MPIIDSMSHPTTAILVLSYNGLAVTQKFLVHLYKHTENFKLLMVDNGSTDGTVEYLTSFAKEHSNMTFIANPTNLGVINGRNFSYEQYLKMEDKPGYLCFLDNDQFVESGWLEHHFQVMEESEADLIGVEAWLLSSSFWPIEKCKRVSEPWSYVGCGGMLMSSRVTDAIGMFDPQFNPCYFEDPDFCYRAADAGFKLAWNSKAKLIHLPHQTLGKNPDRLKNLRESHRKFAEKWKGRRKREWLQFQVQALR